MPSPKLISLFVSGSMVRICDDSCSPLSGLVQAEDQKLLNLAVSELPAREKKVLELKAEDMTFESIGSEIGVSRETVRSDYKRALKRLNKKLAGHFVT